MWEIGIRKLSQNKGKLEWWVSRTFAWSIRIAKGVEG